MNVFRSILFWLVVRFVFILFVWVIIFPFNIAFVLYNIGSAILLMFLALMMRRQTGGFCARSGS